MTAAGWEAVAIGAREGTIAAGKATGIEHGIPTGEDRTAAETVAAAATGIAIGTDRGALGHQAVGVRTK
jgi:hypothetical protein